jgi:SAM-dependent methyltransferase
MQIHRLKSYNDYVEHVTKDESARLSHDAFLSSITPAKAGPFTVDGFSYPAQMPTSFLAQCTIGANGPEVNWRESLQCPVTSLSNRARAAIHFLDSEIEAYPGSAIYVTEQLSALYRCLASRLDNVVGSEYLGNQVPLGSTNAEGIRNEDLGRLSFADESFDVVLSFDVFEHIADHKPAFRECARILRKGGKMLWTVPFVQHEPRNIVRAKVEGGEIVHLLPPEFHGDPLSKEGILCYTHFGWNMLDDVREAGFSEAYALTYRSVEFGYLGGGQYVFVAVK